MIGPGLVVGLGILVWYAWSHKDVPFRNPVEKRPELDSADIIKLRQSGKDVRELAGHLAGDWMEWASWCSKHGYSGECDEAEAIADDLIAIEMGDL